jgi:hypothetical protein
VTFKDMKKKISKKSMKKLSTTCRQLRITDFSAVLANKFGPWEKNLQSFW